MDLAIELEPPFPSNRLGVLVPALVLYGIVLLFSVSGLYVLSTQQYSSLGSQFYLDVFMYVGLPAGILLGIRYLRRTGLPPGAWWSVVAGYLAGIAFIGLILLWANIPDLQAGTPITSIFDEFVILGNLGGVAGFIGGVNRAHAVHNGQLRKELEDKNVELVRKNEQLDEFAGLLTHDLRNPLTVLKARVRHFSEQAEYEAHHVAAMDRAVTRMENIIDDTLTLAHQQSDIQDVASVEIDAISQDAWDNVATETATLNIEGTRTVDGDRDRLAHVFENLFSNSIEHGGSDLTVTVGPLPDGFYIEDDGDGIPPSERDDVFDPGYSTKTNGTGFGLRIVKGIIEAHEWDISATTSSEGGARFEITNVTEPPTSELAG